MKLKFSLVLGIFLFAMLALTNAQLLSSPASPISSQYYEPSIEQFYSQYGIDYTTFWPDFATPESCTAKEGQDFFVSIVPFSCNPSVVRSDLLEDQNVPVFCRLSAVRVNPLIEIAEVKGVTFSGAYPKEVAGVSYHPSKALLKSYNPQLGTGMINDLGYVVVLLKKQVSEKNMSKKINFTLTANIRYDLKNVEGVGKAMFYLPVMTNEEWASNYIDYSFWRNKGYIRAEGIEQDRARISIYSDKDRVIRSFDLKKGETSSIIYMPGFYCQGGLQIKLNEVSVPKRSALLQVDDETLWVSEGSRFLESCTVSKIESLGAESRVVLTCEGKSYELKVRVATKAKINTEQFATGEKVGAEGADSIHLVYIDEKGKFVILAKGVTAKYIQDNKISGEKIRTIYSVVRELVKKGDETAVKNRVASLLELKDPNNAVIVQVGQSFFQQRFDGVSSTSDQDFSSQSQVQAQIEKYFGEAKKTGEELVELYPVDGEEGEIFGADALIRLAKLAVSIKKFETARSIYEKVKEKYPDTTYAEEAEKGKNGLFQYSFEDASTTVTIKRQAHNIFLEKIKEPTAEEAGAIFRLEDGTTQGLLAGETRNVGSDRNIKLVNILDESNIVIDYNYKRTDGKIESLSNKQIRENEVIPGTDIVLQAVNFKRVAGIELLPNFPNELSKTNFSIAVGIEKRAIQLSPEKAKEKIAGLNKSIQKYEQLVSRLANFTDGMQKACFVTSSVLIIKNFVQNIGGKGIARGDVMNKPGGWNSWCNEHKNDAQYGGSSDNCLFQNRAEIEKEVNAVATGIQNVNKKIGEARAFAERNKISTEDAFVQTQFAQFVAENKEKNVTSALGIQAGDDVNTIARKINASYHSGALSMEEMKNIMVYGSLPKTQAGLPDFKGQNLGNVLRNVDKSRQNTELQVSSSSLAQNVFGSSGRASTLGKANAAEVEIQKVTDSASGMQNTESTLLAVPGLGSVLVPVAKQDSNLYNPDLQNAKLVTKSSDGKTTTYTPLNPDQQNILSSYLKDNNVASFKKQTAETCRNEYKDPKVRVFDTGPCKGRASLVPVDVKRGWYAAIKPAVYGDVKTCTESGQVISMWLCNVGSNGREEFESGSNDDSPCIRIDFTTGQPLGSVPCLSSTEASNLVRTAKSELEKASSQYGKKSMSLAAGTFNVIVASSTTGARCTDFMSPGDCKLMFNVCDPVMCPNSRCDLGGKFKVPDVIQSGIIGSLMLCLPNIKEGIYIPVCLSGLREGVRGYVSLLKSYRDCLQEYVNTGRQTGFCDEIHSFYMCDFFWRQVGPLLDVGIPKLIEAMVGQGRGGGEYMTVNVAWENMKSSVGYIQNQYSTQISRAFKVGSTAEFGAEICNNFVSGNYPILGDLADSLLRPESPVQFQAWFDEIPFSDVTVPPTSQYKVYYNIYAGVESGAQFLVYLKSPAETGYIAQQTQKVIASGYAGAGQTATETKDFTAPSGYNEICIRVNTQEECGFKRVSTSFALDFLNDKYMQQQATERVESEKECVAGSPSLYSLAQPSLQAGVEEMIQPAIYQRGIVRVCSTDNPGQNTGPGRWSDVGYCDRVKGIKCWLDEQSITKAIQGIGIKNATLTAIENLSRTIGSEAGTIKTSQATQGEMKDLEDKFNKILKEFGKITDVNTLVGVLGASAQTTTTTSAQPATTTKTATLIGASAPKAPTTTLPSPPVPAGRVIGISGEAIDNANIATLRTDITSAINKANELINRGYNNNDKARVMYWKFYLYLRITERLRELAPKGVVVPGIGIQRVLTSNEKIKRAEDFLSGKGIDFIFEGEGADKKIYYNYYKGEGRGWSFSFDNVIYSNIDLIEDYKSWATERLGDNYNFVYSLKDKNFVEGIKILLKRVDDNPTKFILNLSEGRMIYKTLGQFILEKGHYQSTSCFRFTLDGKWVANLNGLCGEQGAKEVSQINIEGPPKTRAEKIVTILKKNNLEGSFEEGVIVVTVGGLAPGGAWKWLNDLFPEDLSYVLNFGPGEKYDPKKTLYLWIDDLKIPQIRFYNDKVEIFVEKLLRWDGYWSCGISSNSQITLVTKAEIGWAFDADCIAEINKLFEYSTVTKQEGKLYAMLQGAKIVSENGLIIPQGQTMPSQAKTQTSVATPAAGATPTPTVPTPQVSGLSSTGFPLRFVVQVARGLTVFQYVDFDSGVNYAIYNISSSSGKWVSQIKLTGELGKVWIYDASSTDQYKKGREVGWVAAVNPPTGIETSFLAEKAKY
jgi:hypothetical protein